MSLALDYVFASSKDDIKPRNVVRSLPALSTDDILEAAYSQARANPSVRLEAKPEAPCWHVVAAIPGQESVAAAYLISRHAAIYLPVKDGRPFLPGYLFVFAWGLDSQWRRILDAPGISGVLASGERARPIPDAVIDYLRVREAGWKLAAKGKSCAKRKGWRRWLREQEVELPPVYSVTVDEWQPKLRELENAPIEERSRLFATAIGLLT